MLLNETIKLMLSEDYKERFVAEYWQTRIRYEKLRNFCNKIDAASFSLNVEEPKHDCSLELLREQQRKMGEYLHILEVRAQIENINLYDFLKKCKMTLNDTK